MRTVLPWRWDSGMDFGELLGMDVGSFKGWMLTTSRGWIGCA